jgi:hypothetical protein
VDPVEDGFAARVDEGGAAILDGHRLPSIGIPWDIEQSGARRTDSATLAYTGARGRALPP